MGNKKKMGLLAKQRAAGWAFLFLASAMIVVMSFYPMVQALITSFKTGSSANLQWAEPLTYNYKRMFQDKMFMKSVGNTFLYLIIQVPIMLVLAILLAQLLNNKDLKFKGIFRTCIFLPCAVSLVSYIISGFIRNWFVCLVIGIALMIGTLLVLKNVTKAKAQA